MPLLKIAPKTKKESITIKIAGNVIEDLKAYARYAAASQNEVVQEALSFVFAKDTEFQKWKGTHPLAQLADAVSLSPVPDRKSTRQAPAKAEPAVSAQ